MDGQDEDVTGQPRPGSPAPARRADLLALPLPRQVAMLAVWPLLEQVLGFTVGFVDVALAGRLSVQATNAIAVASYVGWLIGIVQGSLGVGSTALIARATGARDRSLVGHGLGQSMLLAPLVGLGIGAFVFLLAPQIAGFAELDAVSHAYCVTYLRIIALAAPFGAILFVGAACLRGAGDTRTPFLVLVAVNLVNATMSWLLVMGPAPFGGRGVAGIAIGTLLGWIVGAALIAVVLLTGLGRLRLRVPRMRPRREILWRILRVGLPNLVEALLGLWLANFLVIRVVGLLASDAAPGAHVIAIRLEALSFMPGFALGIAAATLAGQHLGAGRPDRARHAVILCWVAGAGIMGLMGVMFVAIPEPLVRLVTNEPELLALSPPLLRLAGFVQVFFGTAMVLGQGMRGAGHTRGPMFMTALSMYAVRLPLAYLLGIWLGWGLYGVWIGLCTELAFRGLLFGTAFFRGRWLRTAV